MARVAVVGSGLAGFTAYQTLRRGARAGRDRGLRDGRRSRRPPGACGRRRSGSGRCARRATATACATSFPGLAFSSVRRRRSARPLLDSVLDRYHPTVDEFLSHVERLRERSGWDESLVPRRIERVRAVDGGFDLDGERFPHVLLAPGHPGLNVPEELRGDPRVVHSYEPHDYAADGHGRRRGPRRGDRVAERARGGRRGRVGAPARAGAAPAQRRRATTSPAAGSTATTASRRASGSSACAR